MKCIPPPNAVDDAMRGVCMRRASAKSGKNETDLSRLKGENKCAAAWESLE